jgi:transposase
MREMDQYPQPITAHKTYKYKLQPTPEQEQAMAFVLRRCRELYNAALQERRDAWHKGHKSISDAGWAQFRAILEGKAVYAGRRVVAVPPAYTSQDCSGCGERVEKSLSVRTHICPSCGLVLDRDENAARNIQGAGQALRGVVA